MTLEQLSFGRGSKVTVVFYEMLVVLFDGEVGLYIPFISAARHLRFVSETPSKTKYFRTIPDLTREVNKNGRG
jgi:hypothetical protein